MLLAVGGRPSVYTQRLQEPRGAGWAWPLSRHPGAWALPMRRQDELHGLAQRLQPLPHLQDLLRQLHHRLPELIQCVCVPCLAGPEGDSEQAILWSRGGAAATFRARLPHTERELGLVRATAILYAIYYPRAQIRGHIPWHRGQPQPF